MTDILKITLQSYGPFSLIWAPSLFKYQIINTEGKVLCSGRRLHVRREWAAYTIVPEGTLPYPYNQKHYHDANPESHRQK